MIYFNDKFERIKNDLDLMRVMEAYGVKFRQGKCLCVFHDDSKPSMSIKDNRFTCWACGAHGDVFDWVQRQFNISLVQAAKKLCNDFNLPYMQEQLTKHDRLILKRQERHRNAMKKIAESEAERVQKQYWALCDEYRALKEYIGELFTDKSTDTEEFSRCLARLQYLEQLMQTDSEEVKKLIAEKRIK